MAGTAGNRHCKEIGGNSSEVMEMSYIFDRGGGYKSEYDCQNLLN